MTKAKHSTKFRFEQLAKDSATVHKLYVYDEVRANGTFNWETWNYEESETSAKYFRDQLDAIPDGETIELHVNSVGGEVGEGVTIYNLLRQKARDGSRLIGYVDGMAYSVAMDIIMACDEIHMGLGTSMFLHNPWAYCSGNAEQLRSMAEQLDALADASRQLYLSRSKDLTEDVLKEMMMKETMLAPDTCLKYGFCDFVGEQQYQEDDLEENLEKDPEDDNEKNIIRELQKQLFRQKQINQMLQGLKKTYMKNTLSEAMKHFTN